MGKILKIILLFSIFITCVKEDLIPVGESGDQLIDTGIYEVDSSRSDQFCDFKVVEQTDNCWAATVKVFQDCHYDLLFTRYGNGWTGADATYSLLLPDGKIMWMFGDTFLGTVSAERTRGETPFIRNSIVLQDGDHLTTLFGGTSGNPRAFISPENVKNWYWPLDATIYNGKIQWLLGELGSSGSGGAWDFAYTGFDLAIMDPSTLLIESKQRKIESPEISYGSCLLEDDTYTYIYGIRTRGLSKTAHIARAPQGDLTNQWSFYDGTDWLNHPSDFVIANNISDQFSVIKSDGIFYLITHEPYFSRKIQIMQSEKAEGPYQNRRTIYCTPENTDQVFTYNSFVHPELSEHDELRISYNINSFNFNDLFTNVDLYRPKFIRIDDWK
ncbi:MAG: DUF5005 domain-containing protein [Saprospiraceae bacterium]|nr:DUF5005 domain-containing protein [Saprospiraceae bacterium]